MFLKEFTSTEFQRDAKRVFKAACKEPVIIIRKSKESFVMLSKQDYAKLVDKQ